MPKPTVLTPDALAPAAASTPTAATTPRGASKKKPAEPKPMMPLQVRLPREDVKAIKVAAAQSEQTISDFMLACFHAYMKAGKRQ
jgi:hypothetical protein